MLRIFLPGTFSATSWIFDLLHLVIVSFLQPIHGFAYAVENHFRCTASPNDINFISAFVHAVNGGAENVSARAEYGGLVV